MAAQTLATHTPIWFLPRVPPASYPRVPPASMAPSYYHLFLISPSQATINNFVVTVDLPQCFSSLCFGDPSVLHNTLDLLLGATRATHGAIFGTLTHASFMVGSVTHHTKDTVLPSQRTPHIDLSGALMTNELGSHLPNCGRTLPSPHLLERHWHIQEILGDGSISCGGRSSPSSILKLLATMLQRVLQGHLCQRPLVIVPHRLTRLTSTINKQVNKAT